MKSLAASTRRRLVRSKPCSRREQKNRPAIPFLQKATTTHKRCDSLPMIVLTSLPFALASFVRMAPFFSLVLACWRGASHTTRGKANAQKQFLYLLLSFSPLSTEQKLANSKGVAYKKDSMSMRGKVRSVAMSKQVRTLSRYFTTLASLLFFPFSLLSSSIYPPPACCCCCCCFSSPCPFFRMNESIIDGFPRASLSLFFLLLPGEKRTKL